MSVLSICPKCSTKWIITDCFVTPTERQIPQNLERGFSVGKRVLSISMSCVKRCNAWSSWFPLRCGIRQGVVLSTYLFAIYTDVLVKKVSPVTVCMWEGAKAAWHVHAWKSAFWHIGPRYNAKCKCITISSGQKIMNHLTISWSAHLRSPQVLMLNPRSREIVSSLSQLYLW